MTLTIKLTQAGQAQLLANKEQVALVASFPDGGDYVVVCAAFSPGMLQYSLTFAEEWAVYASQQAIEANRPVEMTLPQAALPGTIYRFTGSSFLQGGPAYSPAVFGFDNQSTSRSPVASGIAQGLTLNGGQEVLTALTIANAPFNQTTYFPTPQQVLVFVATNMTTGLVIPTALLQPLSFAQFAQGVPLSVGNYLPVSLATATTIYFDAATSCFTEASPASPPLS